MQERGHTNVAIVKSPFHKKFLLRYTSEYTLGRCHTYATIVTDFLAEAEQQFLGLFEETHRETMQM